MTPRVLLMTTYYYPLLGGVETHARQLAVYLHRRGFDVQILTKRIGGSTTARDEVDEMTVHRVRPSGDRRRSGKWIALPFFFLRTLRLRSAFDVVVCVDYRGIGIAAITAGRLLRRPIIAQAGTAGVLAPPRRGTGVPPETLLVRTLKSLPRVIYRGASHYVCISKDVERETLSAGVDPERVHYLPHGVDLQRFRPPQPGECDQIRDELGLPRDRTIVLFVGRLSIEKGVMDLLEAWRELSPSGATLVLVGPDMPTHPWNAGPAARKFVAKHGLSDSVHFAGPVDDTAPFYRAADLFVQPSHFEAFGISAIEAMASGVAVVVARVGGLRDFLKPGKNGLMHEPREPRSLASAMAEALGNPPLREALAAAALDTVTKHFDERVLLDRYAALIQATVRAA